jgi:broad specificity phosphatase PhoE
VIERIRAADGDVLVFGHGHLSRILAARWCGQQPAAGAHLLLDAASISVLGYERATRRSGPGTARWTSSRVGLIAVLGGLGAALAWAVAALCSARAAG